MYKVSNFTKDVYRLGEVAKYLGVTTKTVSNYVDKGILPAERTAGGHRIIRREALLAFLNAKNMVYDDSVDQKVDVIYVCCKSTDFDKDACLNMQVASVVGSAPSLRNPVVLRDVEQLDGTRKELRHLVSMVESCSVRAVYVARSDILPGYGRMYLEALFRACNVVLYS